MFHPNSFFFCRTTDLLSQNGIFDQVSLTIDPSSKFVKCVTLEPPSKELDKSMNTAIVSDKNAKNSM